MIEITVDAKKALGAMADVHQRQVPFAMAKAINAIVLEVQGAERQQLRKVFTLRRPEWADRSIKITKFATKREPWAIIGIHPPGGDQRADILSKFEDQTEKLPRGGTIAIPVSARIKRNNADIIANRHRPKAYNFRRQGKRIIGDRGTFVIRKGDGTGLILQRDKGSKGRTVKTYIGGQVATITRGVGARAGGVFALYYLARRARIQPNLKFVATAIHAVDTTFAKHMNAELDKAIATAK